MSTATCTADCHETRSPDREANGRFAKGNKGGPGNPFGRALAANRAATVEAEGPEQIKDVMHALYNKACGGDVGAAKLYLAYVVGKPLPAKEPDLVDVDEFEVAKAKRVPYSEAVIALIDMPVEKATEMAGATPPKGDGVHDDDDEEEEKRERKAEADRIVAELLKTGEFPADSLLAPPPADSDPRVLAEYDQLMRYFVRGLKEGKLPEGSPFETVVDGAVVGSFHRDDAKSAKGRPFETVGDGAVGRYEAVCAVG